MREAAAMALERVAARTPDGAVTARGLDSCSEVRVSRTQLALTFLLVGVSLRSAPYNCRKRLVKAWRTQKRMRLKTQFWSWRDAHLFDRPVCTSVSAEFSSEEQTPVIRRASRASSCEHHVAGSSCSVYSGSAFVSLLFAQRTGSARDRSLLLQGRG